MIKLIQFITYTNIWIALGATSLTAYSFYLNHKPIDYYLLGFVFSATTITYSFQRLLKKKINPAFENDRINWMQRHKTVIITSFLLCGILLIFCLFNMTVSQLLILIPVAIISFFYAGNLFKKKSKSLREIPFMKAHLIAISFAVISGLLPAINSTCPEAIIYSIAIYFIVLSLAILFDVRDVKIDSITMATVPQKIGIKPAKYISIGLFVMGAVLIYFIDENVNVSLALLIIGTPIISYTNETSTEFYFSFLLDGILLIPGIELLLRFFFFHP